MFIWCQRLLHLAFVTNVSIYIVVVPISLVWLNYMLFFHDNVANAQYRPYNSILLNLLCFLRFPLLLPPWQNKPSLFSERVVLWVFATGGRHRQLSINLAMIHQSGDANLARSINLAMLILQSGKPIWYLLILAMANPIQRPITKLKTDREKSTHRAYDLLFFFLSYRRKSTQVQYHSCECECDLRRLLELWALGATATCDSTPNGSVSSASTEGMSTNGISRCWVCSRTDPPWRSQHFSFLSVSSGPPCALKWKRLRHLGVWWAMLQHATSMPIAESTSLSACLG